MTLTTFFRQEIPKQKSRAGEKNLLLYCWKMKMKPSSTALNARKQGGEHKVASFTVNDIWNTIHTRQKQVVKYGKCPAHFLLTENKSDANQRWAPVRTVCCRSLDYSRDILALLLEQTLILLNITNFTLFSQRQARKQRSNLLVLLLCDISFGHHFEPFLVSSDWRARHFIE